jgi:hypothetical protein
MGVHVDQIFSGTPAVVDTTTVTSVNTAGTVAINLTNLKPGLIPVINLPQYFNVVQTGPTTWQIQYKGVTIPKTATTLTAQVGNQKVSQHLFVS